MPIVTLSSDIGLQDFITGAIKGKLLQENEQFNIVDISHQLSSFNYPQAAYICRNAIRNFPKGSFHLVLVNLFDEKPDHLLLIEHDGQYIGCADNGIITMILEETPQKVVALEMEKSVSKNTLYCTSVFAKAINAIAGGKKIEEVGDDSVSIRVKNPLRPMLGQNWMEGQIIFIDNFENVVINIHKDDFEQQRKGRNFSIVFKRNEVIDRISETYADVPEGEKLAHFNSAGYLEISLNKGNAAGLLGLMGYAENSLQDQLAQSLNNSLFYQTVKVYFE
jgi:S-adenosylmethionine hydrolase